MGLVNETVVEVFQILRKKVNECIENHKTITVGIHTNLGDMHNIIIPEYCKVYDDSVSIQAGRFVLNIQNTNDNITYDEHSDSIVLYDENIEIDIDFLGFK